MKILCEILFPVDTGLDLDFREPPPRDLVKPLAIERQRELFLGERLLGIATIRGEIFRFGTGILSLQILLEEEPSFFATLSASLLTLRIGQAPAIDTFRQMGRDLVEQAQDYSVHTYDRRLPETDLYPVFALQGSLSDADAFIRKNIGPLFAMVTGLEHFEEMASSVPARQPLKNLGHESSEVILVERHGAFLSGKRADFLRSLLHLSYAQRWALRSYNYVLQIEMAEAKAMMDQLPPYWRIFSVFRKYRQFSKDWLDFDRDKLEMVSTLHEGIPEVEEDFQARALHVSFAKAYHTEELFRLVERKMEVVAETYSHAREYLSTNFFIAVEIVLILSLAWAVLDTTLLFVIAQK